MKIKPETLEKVRQTGGENIALAFQVAFGEYCNGGEWNMRQHRVLGWCLGLIFYAAASPLITVPWPAPFVPLLYPLPLFALGWWLARWLIYREAVAHAWFMAPYLLYAVELDERGVDVGPSDAEIAEAEHEEAFREGFVIGRNSGYHHY